MLHFFRTHQKYFFVLVTIVIVISFSFFGTYEAFDPVNNRDQVAFVSIEGSPVKRSDVEELAAFISTDSEDKALFGGMWGPNFLNDGVLNKDFLQTGLLAILAQEYREQISRDYVAKLDKEKRYSFYQHPQAEFISLDTAWSYFAPAMKTNLETLLRAAEPLDPAPFEARMSLFVAERKFPQNTLKQVLRFQERQYNWVTPDPQLQYMDLSLFGYHTFEDWFGPRLTRLTAEFIINASKIAEKKGYRVSKEEALADLMRNSELSYKQNSKTMNLGVANSVEYFNEQLRRLNMDASMAAKTWRQVLLFRQLFHDPASAVFVDVFAFSKVNEYLNETAQGDLYRLPSELQLGNEEDLRKFEAYIASVAKKNDTAPLSLPKAYLSVEEVKKNTPELVQKRYVIDFAQADSKQLESRVSIKETWNWEADEKNWSLLTKEFPELGAKNAKSREERLAALDGLDEKTRTRVDSYARGQIVKAHPEWTQEVLAQANRKTQSLLIREKGGKAPLLGVKNPQELMKKLDAAKIGEALTYSPDDQRVYSIIVVERSPKFELSTYVDAARGAVLEDLAKKKISDEQLAKTVAALKSEAEKSGLLKPEQSFTGDSAASLRFYSYVKKSFEKLKSVPSSQETAALVRENGVEKTVDNQFLLEKISYSVARSGRDEKVDNTAIVSLPLGGWTDVKTSPNGDLYFFHLVERSVNPSEGVDKKVAQTRKLLSMAVQKTMMTELVTRLKQANALSLSYLDTSPELSPSEASSEDLKQDG